MTSEPEPHRAAVAEAALEGRRHRLQIEQRLLPQRLNAERQLAIAVVDKIIARARSDGADR
ncbi:MAG: hypothetical protein JOY90_12930 [Bradyrhizobium sp.]|uniref:hypothetical protein n=1 Tax=Bradyrhizobium sp. TaxID=376 RepID=UPI001E0455B7|nr:hypothetical protein [Bradyrhizobium sp.]MBV9561335.1 hypothetical protein [Bradyrhizobium sp.]